MTIRQAVFDGAKRLQTVETPLLDAIVLLSHVMGFSKEQLFASYADEISSEVSERFVGLIEKRLCGFPVSYIRRTKEFYSLEFAVGPGVLVPRPETETLVDAVIEISRSSPGIRRLHDACTGSGCVAISIKHQLPELDISASDISEEALEYFRHNSENVLGEVLQHTQSDLLNEVTGIFDVLVANPPYLTSDRWASMASAGWPEPAVALDGGADGLALYRDLIPQCARHLRPGGYLLLEADPEQCKTLHFLLVQNGFHNTIIYTDLSDRDRVIRAEMKS
jgi:release factor glutamine methyltransferase